MNYCFGRNPMPVPNFLEEILPSLSSKRSLSRNLRVPITNALSFNLSAIQLVGTVASTIHSLTASNICSSVTFSLKTILNYNRLLRYIGFSLCTTVWLQVHVCISYIYQIGSICYRGEFNEAR